MKRFAVLFALMILICGLLLSQAYRGKGRLRGVVKDAEGNPLPGVTVKLFHVKSDGGFQVSSDESGEWVASWMRHGLWYADFEKEGYIPRRISLNIQETLKNPDVELALKKARAPLVPKELLDKLDKGNSLFAEGKYDEAIGEFQKILEKHPQFFQININIGNALMKKEDYTAALPYFQKVLDLDLENAEALISAGNCYIELKNFSRAVESFKKIDKEDITDPVTLYNVGTIFYNNGEVEKAIDYYRQSLVVKNDFIDSYYQLGLAFLSQGINHEALANFEKYLEFDSTSEKAEQVKKFIDYLKKNSR